MNVSYAGWIAFWKWVLIIGLGFYFFIAIIVVPWGLADIKKLFRALDRGHPDD